YTDKNQVYLDGGPSTAFLPDGFYCFEVTNSSGATVLSSDAPSARSFSISSNVTTYSGGPPIGADSRDTPSTTTIALAPFGDSSNGEYKLGVYRYDVATAQSGTAGA